MNRSKMEAGVRQFLEGVLEGSGGEIEGELRDTPARVAEAFERELLEHEGEGAPPRLERVEVGDASGPVFLSGIRFTSVCCHHLLPYRGRAHVAFVPDRWHVGLGGIARVVDWASKRLILQEALAARAAEALLSAIEPRSLTVVLEAEHLCLAVRGAKKDRHRFVTVERRGGPDPSLVAWEAALAAGDGAGREEG